MAKKQKGNNKSKKKDDKGFQYALTVALNYDQIKDHPEKISKIKPFIDKCKWKEIDFPSHSKNWKTLLFCINILYIPYNTEK